MAKITTPALVVLSGEQDSTICLFMAKQKHDVVHAITFNYGQSHAIEITSAMTVAALAGVTFHEVINIVGLLKSTFPLLNDAENLQKYESFEQMESAVGNNIEETFVPMRNTLFFTIAANRAVALGCKHIYTGICQEDNANYPDCTEPFRQSLEVAFAQSLGTNGGYFDWLKIKAPLMELSKAESVREALKIPGCMEALAYSHTSYDGKFPPTDMNHANILRAKGFEEAGVPDPLVLRAHWNDLMPLPETSNYVALNDRLGDDDYYSAGLYSFEDVLITFYGENNV